MSTTRTATTRTQPRWRALGAFLVLVLLACGVAAPLSAEADPCFVPRDRSQTQPPPPPRPGEVDPPMPLNPEIVEKAKDAAEGDPENPAPQAPTSAPPSPSAPTPSTPPEPGTRDPSSAGPPPPRGRRRAPSGSPGDLMTTWRGWWVVNDRALLPARPDAERRSTSTTEGETVTVEWTRSREAIIRDQVLPLLIGVVEPEADSAELMLRGALLALGKAARTDAAPALLTIWLDDADAARSVRAAAALGIGLLRRTDSARQLDPSVLDALRAHLLAVVGDTDAPDLVRGISAVSLGLLGDQPFGTGIHANGTLVVERLWKNLADGHANQDLTVSILTALGLQPAAGVSDEIKKDLTNWVKGQPACGRRLDDVESGHALSTLVRLEGVDAETLLRGVLISKRTPKAVGRAALIAAGRLAGDLSASDRSALADGVRTALRRARDPATRGLAHIAAGYIVAAHLRDGASLTADVQALWRQVQTDARGGSNGVRGFATLALGLAVCGVAEDASGVKGAARTEAEAILLRGLQSEDRNPDERGACAIALGLIRATRAVPVLVKIVELRNGPVMLRCDAAVALGQIGLARPEVERALNIALFARAGRVRAGAALGLSLLSGPEAGRRLLRELEQADTAADVCRVTEPFGYFRDGPIAEKLVHYVDDPKHGAYARASMIVALGNIADPEPRPSLALLGLHANYPDATESLMGAVLAR